MFHILRCLGLGLALLCDIRFCSSDARLIPVWLKRAIHPDDLVTWTLPRLVGYGRALQWLYLADDIPLDDASAAGALNGATRSTVIHTGGQLNNAAEFNNQIVTYQNGSAVRLKDVDEAQMRMVNVAKDLANKGEIMIASKQGEDELIY